ncbi:MAG: hypothetical protein NTW86_19765 [Candidatus Sumerlaeota bacterium]|nr:hypothetical protein [Candidatus Sumerlaeota bacterium]
MNRLSFLCWLAAGISLLSSGVPAAADAPTGAQALALKAVGQPRPLQGPIFGASTAHFYEHVMDNPAQIAVLKSMAIGLDRFSGGSDANFYNWRTGLIEVQVFPNSSAYIRFWAAVSTSIAKSFPHGITMEQYQAFSKKIGAQTILVPNLETSTVADQVEWFKRLAAAGAVPQRIELGNEFWVAMLNDPASLARWPDEPSTVRTQKQYWDAFQPYLPANAKAAIQAASGAVGAVEQSRSRFGQRLRQWDENLRPEPWFAAVTAHLYPRMSAIMGDPKAGTTAPTPENATPRLNAMMAYADQGVEQILQDLERRLPGKEIWITEWNARGAETVTQRAGAAEPMSAAMTMLAATRMALVYLRHPSVTAALFFMLNFNQQDAHSVFVMEGRGRYALAPTGGRGPNRIFPSKAACSNRTAARR